MKDAHHHNIDVLHWVYIAETLMQVADNIGICLYCSPRRHRSLSAVRPVNCYGVMASLPEQPDMFNQALHTASDVVVWEHITDSKRSIRRYTFSQKQLMRATNECIHPIAHSSSRCPRYWTTTAGIMKSVYKRQYTGFGAAGLLQR